MTIPGHTYVIGCHAFAGCTGLSHVSLWKGLLMICDGTFADCTGLISLTLPDGIRDVSVPPDGLCKKNQKGDTSTMFDTNWTKAAILVSYLDKLGEAMANGLYPFSQCAPGNRDAWDGAIVYDDAGDNDIVLDKLVCQDHHDVITVLGDALSDWLDCPVSARVADPNPEDPYVVVTVGLDSKGRACSFEVFPGGWQPLLS